MNRGSHGYPQCITQAVSASMRPRFMNRGSASAAGQRLGYGLGFNEAPIHESGKSAHRTNWSTNASGFNEAPIHESGKSYA